MMSTNQGRVAVVTGANKGIGYFIALQLALSGLFREIVLGCRDVNRAKEAVDSIQAQLPSTVKVSSYPFVLGDTESHNAFAKQMEENFGKVDCLVNNAATAFKNADPTPFKEQTKPTLDVNFRATMDFTEKILPLLKKGNDPRLVNVASMSGRLGQLSPNLQKEFSSPSLTIPELHSLVDRYERDVQEDAHAANGWGNSNYGLSKLALIAATKVLAREHPEIAINCCCPGACKTDMSSHRGSRDPSDGAKNAVMPATMKNPPKGAFFRDYQVSEW